MIIIGEYRTLILRFSYVRKLYTRILLQTGKSFNAELCLLQSSRLSRVKLVKVYVRAISHHDRILFTFIPANGFMEFSPLFIIYLLQESRLNANAKNEIPSPVLVFQKIFSEEEVNNLISWDSVLE